MFVCAAKYIDIQLWIAVLTGLDCKDKRGQSGGPYVCKVAEIGVSLVTIIIMANFWWPLIYFRMLNCFACVHPINLKRDCVFSAFSLDAWSGVDWLLAKEVGFGGRFGSIRRLRSRFATSCTASSLYPRRPSLVGRVPSENQEIPIHPVSLKKWILYRNSNDKFFPNW